MLTKLRVKGFKSLRDLEIDLPRLTVLFGPNASGKSNVLEATQMLARSATARTLADAFGEAIRGHPLEVFAFPQSGLPELLKQRAASFELEADLRAETENLTYRIGVQIQPGSGALSVQDEYLTRLTKSGEPRSEAARIERVGDKLHVRQKNRPGHPWQDKVGQNHSCLSELRYSGSQYVTLDRCRSEFDAWRVYYLDPRVAMRSARPPADVHDIGVLGEDIAPFLYRLEGEAEDRFAAVKRTLRSVIPSVEDMAVDLDDKRGTLDILVTQDGCSFPSRIISEGTLRVLALCAIAVDPWAKGLVAFEEPENGVHPRRLELIAQLIVSLALEQERQVIVTSHSPLFCREVLRLTRERRSDAQLLAVRREAGATVVAPIEYPDGLFEDDELRSSLTSPTEDGVFEAMLLRGWLDE